MAESYAFDWVSNELEARTSLSRLEARGTVRLVLKNVGLDPESVKVHQMVVIVLRLLPSALAKRRVEDAERLCQVLADELGTQRPPRGDGVEDDAYDVFARLDAESSRRPKG